MKKLLLIVLLAFTAPLLNTACTSTSTSAQNAVYKTLASVGAAADVTMKAAAAAKTKGTITTAQWAQIADIHDNQYVPAYNLAVDAAATSAAPAPQAVIDLATRLASLLASFLPAQS